MGTSCATLWESGRDSDDPALRARLLVLHGDPALYCLAGVPESLAPAATYDVHARVCTGKFTST